MSGLRYMFGMSRSVGEEGLAGSRSEISRGLDSAKASKDEDMEEPADSDQEEDRLLEQIAEEPDSVTVAE